MESESVNIAKNEVLSDNSALAVSTEKAEPTEEEMRCCKYCSYQAPDWPMFAVHVLKPSHVKKVAEAMKVRVAVDPILTNITCEVCNVICCGYIPWNAHLMGNRHRKAKEELQQMGGKRKNEGGPIRNSQFGNVHNKKPYDLRSSNNQQSKSFKPPEEHDFSTYPHPLIGLEYVEETQPNGKNRWYHCSLCDVKFDDNLKFAHLVGQKHRLSVLKAKRPEVVKNIDMNSKKRSEITPLLLREATKLEQEEGRQQLKSIFPKTATAGREAKRGRGGNRATRGTTRGGRGNRGMSNSRGRGYNKGQYSTTYTDSFDPNLSYNSAYNANFDNPEYQQSSQSHYGTGQPYSTAGYSSQSYSSQSYSNNGQPYSNNGQSYFSQNMPSSGLEPKSGISANLATALGDLTKLVQTEEDASVALHVSNALTQSLLKFRTMPQ